MDVDIRTIAGDELVPVLQALETSFSGIPDDEFIRRESAVAEVDRIHGAFEDGRPVGAAIAASFRMTVPGGTMVDTAGVTGVGVRPTHRRRGINTQLMRAQLDDIHERGEPLAALYASEGGIYGRFGYGVAAFLGAIDMEVHRSAFIRGYERTGGIRLVDRPEAMALARPIYDAEQRARPGSMALDDRWWENIWFASEKGGPRAIFSAIHDTGGEVDGFATYEVRSDWRDSIPRSAVSVRRLIAGTPEAYADLWRYLFDIDLVHTLEAWNRPADEPLLWMMREPRRLRFRLSDGLYVRVVDVAEALAARRYPAEGSVVFEIDDPFCAWNGGRFVLEAGGDGARCERSRSPADIACTVTDLGSAYLGGVGFRTLHRAGRIRELRPGAMARADAMFAADPAPWCPFMF